jgi:hypothetical protein
MPTIDVWSPVFVPVTVPFSVPLVIVAPLILVAVATPKTGVTNVGDIKGAFKASSLTKSVCADKVPVIRPHTPEPPEPSTNVQPVPPSGLYFLAVSVSNNNPLTVELGFVSDDKHNTI